MKTAEEWINEETDSTISFKEQVVAWIESYAKETAVKFRMDTSPLTPQIVDGEKKVREQTERLYDNWKNK